MSSYIDKKFINMISSTLINFKWKKEDLANCRCPICGDSQKNKVKCRGYFYCKDNSYFYKCHNCGAGMNIYNFLKEVSPSLCKEYSLERFRNGETGKSNYKKPEEKELFIFKDAKPKFKKKDAVLDTIESKPVLEHVENIGNELMIGCKKLISQYNLDDHIEIIGYPARHLISFKGSNDSALMKKSLFQQVF